VARVQCTHRASIKGAVRRCQSTIMAGGQSTCRSSDERDSAPPSAPVSAVGWPSVDARRTGRPRHLRQKRSNRVVEQGCACKMMAPATADLRFFGRSKRNQRVLSSGEALRCVVMSAPKHQIRITLGPCRPCALKIHVSFKRIDKSAAPAPACMHWSQRGGATPSPLTLKPMQQHQHRGQACPPIGQMRGGPQRPLAEPESVVYRIVTIV